MAQFMFFKMFVNDMKNYLFFPVCAVGIDQVELYMLKVLLTKLISKAMYMYEGH